METGIFKALTDIMKETVAIGKDKTNTMQGYKFRGIDDVYNAVHPLFAKHGVFSVPQVLEEKTEERTSSKGNALIYRVLRVKYTFFTSDGSFVESIVIGEGMDSGDKASNKAMAVAHKYAILQILSIPTNDDKDPENDSHDVKPLPAQKADGKKTILDKIGKIVTSSLFSDAERAFYRNACKGKDLNGLEDILLDARQDIAQKEKEYATNQAPTEQEIIQEDLF